MEYKETSSHSSIRESHFPFSEAIHFTPQSQKSYGLSSESLVNILLD